MMPRGRRERPTEPGTTSVASYIRTQATITALVNVVVNPLLGWVTNRGKDFIPLWSLEGISLDLVLTSIILSVLVALFAAGGAHRELRAGHLTTTPGSPRAGPVLSRLPSGAWPLGLLIGVAAAVVATLVVWILHLLGLTGLSFWAFLLLKAVYGGCLGCLVARWVILRQLAEVNASR
ncbi:MAG: hypothetical protein WAW17_13540 [Rhodococcus sp. (in: high G+C Gram-positive bacteria)]|uniref:hypothetical protein n=1 Tax=Rhodococcus sp. TaxID=1831 RepID=UPI003BAEDCD0